MAGRATPTGAILAVIGMVSLRQRPAVSTLADLSAARGTHRRRPEASLPTLQFDALTRQPLQRIFLPVFFLVGNFFIAVRASPSPTLHADTRTITGAVRTHVGFIHREQQPKIREPQPSRSRLESSNQTGRPKFLLIPYGQEPAKEKGDRWNARKSFAPQ